MGNRLYDEFIFDCPYMKDLVARTYEGGKSELIVETTDGRIYSYYMTEHAPDLISRGEPTEEDRRRIFGKKLKRMISSNGMNQYDFARELGVNVMTISNYVTGKTAPSFFQVQRMMRILNCNENDLFFMG